MEIKTFFAEILFNFAKKYVPTICKKKSINNVLKGYSLIY
jgi:hypothetical protein